MNLAEMKELIKVLVTNVFIGTAVTILLAYIFALITYKKAHKNVKKTHKTTNKNVKVVFNIDSKGKTLQEVLFEKKVNERIDKKCLNLQF